MTGTGAEHTPLSQMPRTPRLGDRESRNFECTALGIQSRPACAQRSGRHQSARQLYRHECMAEPRTGCGNLMAAALSRRGLDVKSGAARPVASRSADAPRCLTRSGRALSSAPSRASAASIGIASQVVSRADRPAETNRPQRREPNPLRPARPGPAMLISMQNALADAVSSAREYCAGSPLAQRFRALSDQFTA